MLVIFSGLPGTGKTTLARTLAGRLAAMHLRVDTIEQALRSVARGDDPVGPEGYFVAYAIAADNLRLGRIVIADSVNPLPETRDAWREVGRKAGVATAEVEIVCSDPAEHRRRVETRRADIAGFRLPSWQDVVDRDYRPWDRNRLIIDTAGRGVDRCLSMLCDRLPSPKAG